MYIREFYEDYVIIESSEEADCILRDTHDVYTMITEDRITDAFAMLYPDIDVNKFDVFTHEIEQLLCDNNSDRFWHE